MSWEWISAKTISGSIRTQEPIPRPISPSFHPIASAWFTHVEFRKAISHCINREESSVMFSGASGGDLWPDIATNTEWYNPDIPKFEYDLDAARRILDSLQFIDRNGDGIREDPQGNPIEFTFITNRENGIRERMGNIIQESFKEAGLNGRMKLVDFNTLVTAIADSFDYEACLLGLTGSDYPFRA
ncbi:MAG: hypothetical protein IPI28_08945 [Candidatus Omnitrophica bacterium]|nr:hypothetical protein [Candidatus Omnitrophota bacterium]